MTTFPFQWYNLMALLCTPYTLGCFLFEWRVIHSRECCSGVYSDEHLNDTRVRPWFATAYLYNEPLYRDQSTRHDLVCLTHCDQRAFSNTFSTCPEWSYAVWFEFQWSLFLRAQLTINKQWYISWYVFERAAADKPLHNVWSPRLIPRFLFSISNVRKLPRATTNVQKNKSYVGLFISYVGLYKSYVGDKKSYVGNKKSYVGLIFLHICCGPRKLPY